MRRIKLVVIASALILAGCSSTTSSSGGPENGGLLSDGTGTGDALTDVAVSDSFSPLTLVPVSTGTFPFLGTDDKYHVAYDLQLTNASRVPGTLEKIDVVDAHDPKNVVASFSGMPLVDPNCPFGDCNRLRLLPSANASDTVIPPQESRALLLDFAFDTLAESPKAVIHHLYGTGALTPAGGDPKPINYLAAPLDISAGTPRVIGPPLKGTNWIALNGCCEPGFPHRTSLNSTNGKLTNSQRFAIDWKRANDQGEFYTGDKTKNESYVDYGEDILAVADGTVVATLDTEEANAPGVLPATDPVLAAKLTLQNIDGNHIVLDIGGGEYAMYAHLIKGTLKVKPGDKVKTGDVIAKLGNTGNANASHLHFQIMTGPSLLGADGIPYVIDSFDYDGQVPPQMIVDADDYLSGSFFGPERLKAPEPRTDQLPLSLAIVNFP